MLTSLVNPTPAADAARLREIWVGQALRPYGLSAAALEVLQSSENLVSRVFTASGESYCLRMCPVGSVAEEELESELLVLEAIIANSRLQVPQPVRTTGGELLSKIDTDETPNGRLCVLFRWVQGRDATQVLSPPLVEAIGATIGYLHVFSRSFRPPAKFLRPCYDADWLPTITGWLDRPDVAPDIGPHERQVLRQATAKICAQMAVLGEDPRYFGLVHSDLHFGNFIVDGARVQVIDFEWCAWGHYLYDLASALRNLAGQPELRRRLLVGYCKVCPLPQTDESQMEAFMAAHELVLLEWIFSANNSAARRREERPVAKLIRHLERFVCGQKMLD